MANICLYVCRCISLSFLIAAIVMTAIFAKTRCIATITAGGVSQDCADAVEAAGYCSAIYIGSRTTSSADTAMSCPWYPRDLGVGFTGLGLAFIFLVVSTVSSCFKSPIMRLAKIFLGWLAVIFLLITIILMAADLFGESIPDFASMTGTVVTTKIIHLINIILVGLAFICYLILAIYETREKGDNKAPVVKVHQKVNMTDRSINMSSNMPTGRSMAA